MAWGAADVDRWGGPTAAFKQRLFAETFDLALDLNHEARFFSLAVMMESGATVRAGYAGSMRDELYTFLVRPGSQDPAQALQALLIYLGRPEPERRPDPLLTLRISHEIRFFSSLHSLDFFYCISPGHAFLPLPKLFRSG